MWIWIIRVVALAGTVLMLIGCWQLADWLIAGGHIPGTNDPDSFGYVPSRAAAVFALMLLGSIALSILTLCCLELPRSYAKRRFWSRQDQKWPRA